jgi:hypothetical protein
MEDQKCTRPYNTEHCRKARRRGDLIIRLFNYGVSTAVFIESAQHEGAVILQGDVEGGRRV